MVEVVEGCRRTKAVGFAWCWWLAAAGGVALVSARLGTSLASRSQSRPVCEFKAGLRVNI